MLQKFLLETAPSLEIVLKYFLILFCQRDTFISLCFVDLFILVGGVLTLNYFLTCFWYVSPFSVPCL